MFIQALGCLRLALVLPKYPGEIQLIAIPMSCTMGWVQSPPSFCTMSKTICDITNQRTTLKAPTPVHRCEATESAIDILDYSMIPRPCNLDDSEAYRILCAIPGVDLSPRDFNNPDKVAPPSKALLKKPLAVTEVFIDDFIQLGQGGMR